MTAPAPNSTAPKVVGAEKIKVVVSAIVPLNNLVTRFEFKRAEMAASSPRFRAARIP